ncbi:MAG: hypothetical protein M3P26_15465 [Gemmatimonadota bacterium]|nr:hypothetical protein [Gemmatimonadota bacterium]
MTSFFWFTYVSLWALSILTLFGTLLLYRHLGTMLMSGRQRIELKGLDKGALTPALGLNDPEGKPFILDWRLDPAGGKTGWIVILASAHCPICSGLWEKDVPTEAAALWPDASLVWIDTELRSRPSEASSWTMATSGDGSAASMLEVPGFPFGYAIDATGRVAAKALVNNMADIGRLVHVGLRKELPPNTRAAPPPTGVRSEKDSGQEEVV